MQQLFEGLVGGLLQGINHAPLPMFLSFSGIRNSLSFIPVTFFDNIPKRTSEYRQGHNDNSITSLIINNWNSGTVHFTVWHIFTGKYVGNEKTRVLTPKIHINVIFIIGCRNSEWGMITSDCVIMARWATYKLL